MGLNKTLLASILASAFQSTALPFSKVVCIGASQTYYSFGQDLTTPNAAATTVFQNNGLDVEVYGYGWYGARVDLITTKVQEAFTAFPDSDVLFIIEGGGNNVTAYRPYSGMSTEDLALNNLHFQQFINTIVPRKSQCLVANISFRAYANITSNVIFNDESQGSLPFNENILLPKIVASLPESINIDGSPYLDVYNWSRNSFKKILSADGVHYSTYGEEQMRQFYAKRVKFKILQETAPDVISRLDAVTVKFGTSTAQEYNIVSATQWNAGAPITLTKDFQSSSTVSLSITNYGTSAQAPASSSGGNPTEGGITVYTGDLYTNNITSSSIYLQTPRYADLTFSGFTPNTAYDVYFVGSRSAADERITRLSSVDGSVFADINTSASPAQRPKFITVTTNSFGALTVRVSHTGTTYAYLSGIQVKRSQMF
jgi:hypothetical protein